MQIQKSFPLLFLAFIACTILGTLSHEYGHILVAKILGYQTRLHHGSMDYYHPAYLEDPTYLSLKDTLKSMDGVPHKQWSTETLKRIKGYKEELNLRYPAVPKKHQLWINMGGPLQTIGTGCLGLLLLLYRRNVTIQYGLALIDWIAVFLALFWLRQVFNPLHAFLREFTRPDGSWFGGDEARIAQQLDLWPGTLSLTLAAMGLFSTLWVILCVVPKNFRISFISAGLLGGFAGYFLWMSWLGPIILP